MTIQGRVIGRMRRSVVLHKQSKTVQSELQSIYLCPMVELKGALAFGVVVAIVAEVIEGAYDNLYGN